MPSWGEKIKINIFGASHDKEIGVEIDGLPKGFLIDFDSINQQLQRRAPGRNKTSTPRFEPDAPQIITGVEDGVTTGKTLRMIIENTNVKRKDYDILKKCPRPGHADFTAFAKYNDQLDMSGGGPFSGRLTAPLVFAGEICRQILGNQGINIISHISEIYNICDTPIENAVMSDDVIARLKQSSFAVIDQKAGQLMQEAIEAAAFERDSVGGIVECAMYGVPAGIGGPMFEGIEGKIASIMFGIPAVKAIEFGNGFTASKIKGSQNNDEFKYVDGKVVTATNNCGGILGGISNGMPITFKVGFKPTPSIGKVQNTVNLETKENTTLEIKGRHDPCIVARAVPVVEAAAAIAILDLMI